MKKFCLMLVLLAGSFFFSGLTVYAKNMVVVGIPIVQSRSSIDVSHNLQLDNNQKTKNRLIITKDDEGKYYWETRDKRELTFKRLKHFDLFLDLKTGGYIKVVKQTDGRYAFMEHISIQRFKAFTYWGILNLYEP